MKSSERLDRFTRPPRTVWAIEAALVCAIFLIIRPLASAGSATWSAAPANNSWNNPANWTPQTVPNGPSDTATFGFSTTTSVVWNLVSAAQLNALIFASDATSPYSISIDGINVPFTTGIENRSGVQQNLVISDEGEGASISFTGRSFAGQKILYYVNDNTNVTFHDSSKAATATFWDRSGSLFDGKFFNGGQTIFLDSSTADRATFNNDPGIGDATSPAGGASFFGTSSAQNASFNNNGATSGGVQGGYTIFNDTSIAAKAVFNNYPGTVSGATGGTTTFDGSSSAGSATVINRGATVPGAAGGLVVFRGTSNASTAILRSEGGTVSGAGGGTIQFIQNSSGGTAQVTVTGTGTLDISTHLTASITLGSVAGSGSILIGQNNLTVGANNLDTAFAGNIDDGGLNGSLTKIGLGRLTLTSANNYARGTTIQSGTLTVMPTAGSATGSGPVLVNQGTLSGTSALGGNITIGSGFGPGAFLAPGVKGTGFLSGAGITFHSDGIYQCDLDTRKSHADSIGAAQITIFNGAQFALNVIGNQPLATGTGFVVISNTSSQPIAGQFVNLADGSTITVGRNTFLVSYEGGDGNDLTLTVQ